MAFLNDDSSRLAKWGRRGLNSGFTTSFITANFWIMSFRLIGPDSDGAMTPLLTGTAIVCAISVVIDFLVGGWALAKLRKMQRTGDPATQEAIRRAQLTAKQLRQQRNAKIILAVLLFSVAGRFFGRMINVRLSWLTTNQIHGLRDMVLLWLVVGTIDVIIAICSDRLLRRRQAE
ncbi:hypothetical protein [Schleiferilactobacillus shenzhenensis]|uniref:Uncharacterized protein n=1 Tax=Schleiferilactobacillus shenzhenensis LY-73 TaxID=1231336 RepID=U4TSW7_9LACO|nr:hypothetical protein [Schleiferilactobacillus shenzhenensis]ERL64973.1 hypothetical protein L248_3135 [Schleiferilactobacillus shenzhenensis LY-73]